MSLEGLPYDETLGQIIDYQELSKFLLDEIRIEQAKWFLDVPCGTGSLLHSISTLSSKINLIGVDISQKQLKEARKKINARFYDEDIFKLNKVINTYPQESIFVHSGFSFLNTLNPQSRYRLLAELFTIRSIGLYGFEIQNYDDQIKFKSNFWYELKLPNRGVMRSKSVYASKFEKKLTLDFRFLNESVIREEILYDYPIDHVERDLKKIGWKYDILPANYRSNNATSHFFILLNH